MAQRAYRSRREASVSVLQFRVDQLETTLEKMSTAVIALSDRLFESEVVTSDVELSKSLRDTLQTCLYLAEDVGQPKDHKILSGRQGNDASRNTLSRQRLWSMFPPELGLASPHPNMQGPANSHQGFTGPFALQDATENSPMSFSKFMEQLDFECLQHGYSMLTDLSIPDVRVVQGFWFLMRFMDRRRLTAYIKALMQKRDNPTSMGEFNEVPFLRLGGAGTHYPVPLSQSHAAGYFRSYQHFPLIEDPLAQFSPDVHKELDGIVFDIVDVVGYLQQQNVLLSSSASLNEERASSMLVDAVCLINCEFLKHFN